MNFIGVDLHKKSITICVMDEKRKVLARKTLACTQTNEIVESFRQFRPSKVVVEATASYVWFVELVERLAEKVVPANPTGWGWCRVGMVSDFVLGSYVLSS